GKHGTSKIYKILTEINADISPPYIEQWEREIGATIDAEKQRKMFRIIHGNINMQEVEMNYKCLARWYITPSVAHRLSGDNSPLCWRGCGGRGTMFHIWWECSKIQEYWGENSKLDSEHYRG
ncbi:unnamed protein product, partial [Staurois parvus]